MEENDVQIAKIIYKENSNTTGIENTHIIKFEIRWILPRSGRIRVYVDAAFKDNYAMTEVVIQWDTTQTLYMATQRFQAIGPLEVEFRAAEFVMHMCKEKGWINGDFVWFKGCGGVNKL